MLVRLLYASRATAPATPAMHESILERAIAKAMAVPASGPHGY